MNELNKLLNEEIKSEIEGLSELDPGSEEHSTAVENLTKLYKLNIEEVKLENEKIKEERDEQLKRDQLKEQVKDRYFRLGVDAAGIVLPLIFYATWMRKGLKFEETGTFTSTTFRGLFNSFKPTRIKK